MQNTHRPPFLFVIGAPKTGTSIMGGMLNCHPDIWIMMEAFMRKEPKHYDEIRDFKKAKNIVYSKYYSITKIYNRLCKSFSAGSYKYFGDKWACLDNFQVMEKWMNEFNPHKIIFTLRDVRSWFAHDATQQIFIGMDPNEIICQYVYYFVRSFKLSDCIRVRLIDQVQDPYEVMKKVSNFLPLIESGEAQFDNWWDKIGNYDDVNKMAYPWWHNRASAHIKPYKLDIKVEIKNNILWHNILPIFDKYFNNIDGIFQRADIRQDLCKIINIYNNVPKITFDDLYNKIEKAAP